MHPCYLPVHLFDKSTVSGSHFPTAKDRNVARLIIVSGEVTLNKFFFKFVHLFLREKERARAAEGQREGDGESTAGSTLWAQSPSWGWNPPIVRSPPELKSRA